MRRGAGSAGERAVVAVAVAGIVGVWLLAPPLSGSFDVGIGDRPFGEWLSVVVVTITVPVVGGAFESSVELAGRPVVGVGNDARWKRPLDRRLSGYSMSPPSDEQMP